MTEKEKHQKEVIKDQEPIKGNGMIKAKKNHAQKVLLNAKLYNAIKIKRKHLK